MAVFDRVSAKAAGYSDDEINQYLAQKAAATPAPVDPFGGLNNQISNTLPNNLVTNQTMQAANSSYSPAGQQQSPPPPPAPPAPDEEFSTGRKIMNFGANVLQGIANPFIETGKNIGGAAYEGARSAGTALGNKNLYTDAQGNTINNPFLSQKELDLYDKDPRKAIAHQLANSAEIGSYAIPFGKAIPGAQNIANPVLRFAANAATKAALPGGAVSAIYAGAEQAKKDQNQNIIPAAIEAFPKGAALATILYGAGEGLKALSSKNTGEPNALENVGKSLRDSTRKITVRPDISGAQQEARINDTLDKLGIDGPPQKQYEQLLPKMQDLSDKIDQSLQANPQQIPVQSIKEQLMANLKDQLRTKELDTPTAQKAIDGYLQDLTGASNDGIISSPDLFNVKVNINGDYGKVQDLIDKGVPLNPTQKVISATRKTVDDIISAAHPDVKEATLMQSDLFDAANSLAKARFNPPTLRAFGISLPGVVTQTAANAGGRAIQGVGAVAGAANNVVGKVGGGIGDILANPLTQQAAVIGTSAAAGQASQPAGQPQINASRQAAVQDLIKQGVTNPNDILNTLNQYDNGQSTGGGFTLDEIKQYQGLPTQPSLVPQAQAAGLPNIAQNPVSAAAPQPQGLPQTPPNLTAPISGYSTDALDRQYAKLLQTAYTQPAAQQGAYIKAAEQIKSLADYQRKAEAASPASKPQQINPIAQQGADNLTQLEQIMGLKDKNGTPIPGAKFNRLKTFFDNANPITVSAFDSQSYAAARNYLNLTSKYPPTPDKIKDTLKTLFPSPLLSDKENQRRLTSLHNSFNEFYYAKPTDQTDTTDSAPADVGLGL